MPPVCQPPTPEHPASDPEPLADAEPATGAPGLGGDGAAALATDNAVDGGASRPPPAHEPPRQIPTSLLRRAQEPPASPRTRARTRLLELVVVRRTPALQAAEDALSLALLTLVVGTRPAVSPAMVRDHLAGFFGITEDRVSVRRTRPDDFIVRFERREDLELVLSTPHPAGAPPFVLRWRRWSRLIMGSAGAFRFRVLVGLKLGHTFTREVQGDGSDHPRFILHQRRHRQP